jgi:hypothetical protein
VDDLLAEVVTWSEGHDSLRRPAAPGAIFGLPTAHVWANGEGHSPIPWHFRPPAESGRIVDDLDGLCAVRGSLRLGCAGSVPG